MLFNRFQAISLLHSRPFHYFEDMPQWKDCKIQVKCSTIIEATFLSPLDRGRELNAHKTFGRRPRRLLPCLLTLKNANTVPLFLFLTFIGDFLALVFFSHEHWDISDVLTVGNSPRVKYKICSKLIVKATERRQ